MLERFRKLLGELKIHGKFYDKKEVNLKFLLTLPDHLESRVTTIREGRNLNNISLETLYGVLKSYELEHFQKRSIQSGHKNKMANMSNALIAHDPRIGQQGEYIHIFQQSQPTSLKTEEEENEDDKVVLELEDDEEDEYYTLEKMESMDNPAMAFMARKFKNLKFKRKQAVSNLRVSSQGSTRLVRVRMLVETLMMDTNQGWWIDRSEVLQLWITWTLCWRVQKAQAIQKKR